MFCYFFVLLAKYKRFKWNLKGSKGYSPLVHPLFLTFPNKSGNCFPVQSGVTVLHLAPSIINFMMAPERLDNCLQNHSTVIWVPAVACGKSVKTEILVKHHPFDKIIKYIVNVRNCKICSYCLEHILRHLSEDKSRFWKQSKNPRCFQAKTIKIQKRLLHLEVVLFEIRLFTSAFHI